MSFLGVDVGTTGCKAVVFAQAGATVSSAYSEYDVSRPRPDHAELDSAEVWGKIKSTIARAAQGAAPSDPIQALSVASMGEAVVPVTHDRRIVGPSILIVDPRGSEYLGALRSAIDDLRCYSISGNAIGNQFGLTKLMWMRDHTPQLYERTYKFLNWSGFVSFMLGAEPTVDFSLANRMLLFDIENEDWSADLIRFAGLDREKLPDCVASGTIVGKVAPSLAGELNLPEGTLIASGAHDQCANALGSGSLQPGTAMYGMGTFPTIVPIYTERPDADRMIPLGLNTEHHAAPGRYVSFIYHMGGSIVKWYRDTFAGEEHRRACERGEDIYNKLFEELPREAGPLLVLPHFAPMGPPDFVSDSSGIILGLKTYSKRGEILKAIIEANNFAHRITVEKLESVGIPLHALRAVGGGSRSDAACQICADILNKPVLRSNVTEAGALGAAMLAGLAAGAYETLDEAAERIVSTDTAFDPVSTTVGTYDEIYERYLHLRTLTLELTREWSGWKEHSR